MNKITKKLFLLQMAGQSGAGKSTLAYQIAQKVDAIVVDYDILKTTILNSGCNWDLSGKLAYETSRAIALAILKQGKSVILDSPCNYQIIIDQGTQIALKTGVKYAFIECFHPNISEINQRLESRSPMRSQMRSLKIAPPDAPKNPSNTVAKYVFLARTKYPVSKWSKINTYQSPKQCLKQGLSYLEELLETKY